MNIGGAIESVRKQKKIKQNELAEKAFITQSYLSLLENNKKDPNVSTLKNIADALNTPLPVLLFLSLDENDIPETKVGIYKQVEPLLKNLIENLFIHEQ